MCVFFSYTRRRVSIGQKLVQRQNKNSPAATENAKQTHTNKSDYGEGIAKGTSVSSRSIVPLTSRATPELTSWRSSLITNKARSAKNIWRNQFNNGQTKPQTLQRYEQSNRNYGSKRFIPFVVVLVHQLRSYRHFLLLLLLHTKSKGETNSRCKTQTTLTYNLLAFRLHFLVLG